MWLLPAAGSQDSNDHLHTQGDLRPRTHYKTLPVSTIIFSIVFTIFNISPLLFINYVRYQLEAIVYSVDDLTNCVLASFTSEAYPSCTVTDIRFCFNVHMLMRLDLERYRDHHCLQQKSSPSIWGGVVRGTCACFVFCRRKAMKGRLYFTTKAQKEGKIMIKTHPCAQIFCCDICGFEQVCNLIIMLSGLVDYSSSSRALEYMSIVLLHGYHIATGWHCNPNLSLSSNIVTILPFYIPNLWEI